MQKILIIDDDQSLCTDISTMLARENFVPVVVSDGKAGFERALIVKPQLLLMDAHLPGMNGVEVCRRLRSENNQTPIIVLSAVGNEVDKVLLLEIGADDYMVKPFGLRELMARIRAVLRRTAPVSQTSLRFSDVEIDIERRTTTRAGREVKLTPSEYNLLLFFVQHADHPLTRDAILDSVWGYDFYPQTRTVDSHVVRLRQKLERDPTSPRHFLTIHGVGYRFML